LLQNLKSKQLRHSSASKRSKMAQLNADAAN